MSCKKISIGTWATPLKTRSNYSVGEMQFSHINWASSIEINAKITVMSSNDISKFQKELEALLAKYHCENIWKREEKKKPKREPSKTNLEKAIDKAFGGTK